MQTLTKWGLELWRWIYKSGSLIGACRLGTSELATELWRNGLCEMVQTVLGKPAPQMA